MYANFTGLKYLKIYIFLIFDTGKFHNSMIHDSIHDFKFQLS